MVAQLPMGSQQILIVEDESIVAFDIEQCLKALGYGVPAVVGSGEDALKVAGKSKPDLVLMDVMLAGEIDGVEAASRIRRDYDIPIVYLTAYTDEATLRRAKVTEPDGYLVKPFEEIQLQTSIEMALYRHKKSMLLRNEQRRNEIAAMQLNDGLWDLDFYRDSLYFSPGCEKLFNVNSSNITREPETWLKNVHPDDMGQLKGDLVAMLKGQKKDCEHEFRVKQSDGEYTWLKCRVVTMHDERGKVYRMVGTVNDISTRKKAEDGLIHFSFNDPLTDLPNRVAFFETLGKYSDSIRTSHSDRC